VACGPRRHPCRQRGRRAGPFGWDSLTVQVAALAVRTGISPRELYELDATMLDAMWRVLSWQVDEQKKAADQAKSRRRR